MKKILSVFIILVLVYLVGYLITVVITSLISWLICSAFNYDHNWNIWAMGGIVYISWLLFGRNN